MIIIITKKKSLYTLLLYMLLDVGKPLKRTQRLIWYRQYVDAYAKNIFFLKWDKVTVKKMKFTFWVKDQCRYLQVKRTFHMFGKQFSIWYQHRHWNQGLRRKGGKVRVRWKGGRSKTDIMHFLKIILLSTPMIYMIM